MAFRAALRPLIGYGFAAIVFTWPLAVHPFRLLGSVQGQGDSFLNLWILGWDLRTIATHPAALFTGQVFNANIFHPATGTLAYSDHLLLQATGVAPLYLLTHDLVFCYNAMLVLSLVACAWAMHALTRAITASEFAAWTAGLAWGFAPYHFGHLIHAQLQALYFLPLALLFLHRVLTRGRRVDVCLLGVMVAAQAIASVYYGVIGAVALVIAAIGLLIAPEDRGPGTGDFSRPRAVLRLLAAAVIAALLVAPVAYQYLRVQQSEGFGRTLTEASQGSATAGSYLRVAPMNLVYGRTGLLVPASEDPNHKATEQVLFPGFVLTLLAAIGLFRGWRRESRPLVLAFALVGLAGFLLSLGPDGIRPLYALLHRTVFGFQAIRAPARFGVLVLFALTGLAALGARDLARVRPRVALGAILLVALECLNAPIPYVAAPRLDTRVGAWLRDAPEPGAVLYLPLATSTTEATPVMIQSLIHGRPIVNGYSGQRPAFFDGLAQAMAGFPSLETLSTLHGLHVTFVVSAQPLATHDFPLVERARFDDGVVYEVRWTDEAEAALAARDDARPLPRLGPLPFGVGETAVYTVIWTSGPLSIPAGHGTLRVLEGRDGGRFQFSVSATTASWISTFFEADDRFDSVVDDGLRPMVVEQHLHEGSRRVDRTMVFDRAAHLVRLQQAGAAAVPLPLVSDALDPISALYYLRAVPIPAGAAIRIPINDWGKNLVMKVEPGRVETILLRGASVEAVRLEPQLVRRDGPAVGYHLVAWMSRDARNIPLIIAADGLAGAGSVRLELESFTSGR